MAFSADEFPGAKITDVRTHLHDFSSDSCPMNVPICIRAMWSTHVALTGFEHADVQNHEIR